MTEQAFFSTKNILLTLLMNFYLENIDGEINWNSDIIKIQNIKECAKVSP